MGWTMGECTDKGCKQDLTDVREAVFKDAPGGCRWDINWLQRNILTKKVVWGLLAIVGIPAYYSAIDLWAGEKMTAKAIVQVAETQKKLDEQGEKREARLIKLEEQFCNLKEMVKEVKDQQSKDTNKILEAIKNQ